ncbi:pyruvate kinase [Mangrovimonas sp. AS39]|uniref:pyruvate kinase n=1 Tax=Mangrovimonas futianensis TaxID=2895523 RepID=UPI001E3DCAEE|nr:pyruvate kinase [Mangrovimonas futianensis]MCF1190756.1 pyruvate kinase [Mangrovimonas futianensis]MCF1194453.1 pyruvate kinase [Mangrovimonas futianensis]
METTDLTKMVEEIDVILEKLIQDQHNYKRVLKDIHPDHENSAINLIHYLTLRSFDLRELQHQLGILGMSRLARAEAHTEASLKITRYYLLKLLNKSIDWPQDFKVSILDSERLLTDKTNVLFGRSPENRKQRIMVTMPGYVANDRETVEKMIVKGMKIARINCAHDTQEDWFDIIQHIKAVDAKLGRRTIIAMDISGPKIRTGEVKKGIVLYEGDELQLSRVPLVGRKAQFDKNGTMRSPAIIACTLPEVFDYLHEGNRVYFDDGAIKSEIVDLNGDIATVKILRSDEKGVKLKADKGINFPDSNLNIRGLTHTDRENLKFIAKYADIVNFSFVNSVSDVQEMHECLKELDAFESLGVIYKIETQAAFNHLEDILLEALKAPKVGVMIARGDLAIETSWKDLGYIQKEMLALCNACHIPIVWATQVLEKLAKKGLPSRSEITDAVTATKAECIMLNKGPHILRAIELLDQIIEHMEQYQDKNAPLLPKLKKLNH